ICLPHEHILVDCGCYLRQPTNPDELEKAQQPVGLNNLSWIRRNYLSNRDNLLLEDREVAIREVGEFLDRGGRTIIDVSSKGLARDPVGLRDISRRSGLNIIMGSGYYVYPSHPSDMDERSAQAIA